MHVTCPAHLLIFVRITVVFEEKCNLTTIKQFFQTCLLFLFDFNTLMITILLRFNYVSNRQESSHVSCDISRACHIITASSLVKSISFALDPILN